MTSAPSPAAVVRELEQGREVVLPTSNGFVLRRLLLSIVVGAVLLGFFALIVVSTLEQGGSLGVIAVNLRIWAIIIGAVLCLIVAPWALVRRMLRAESLVLTRDGLAEKRSGADRAGSFLAWTGIEEIQFERRQRFAPRVLTYRLTEEAARERGLASPGRRTQVMRSGFAASPRQLSAILSAAHSRFAGGTPGAV